MTSFLSKFKNFRASKKGKFVLFSFLLFLLVSVFFIESRWIQKFCSISVENPTIYSSCKNAPYRLYLTPVALSIGFLLLWFYDKFYLISKYIISYLISRVEKINYFFGTSSLKIQLRYCIIITALFMITIFYLNSGFLILNPLNTAWLSSGDLAQHYMGWVVYRAEDWQFPLGKMSLLNYPFGSNVGFTDSLPLFAVFFKLFRNFLPNNFQYIGIFLFSCYLLQAVFSSLIVKSWKCHFYFKLLSAILIAFAPTLIFRENMGHDTLVCHWLILAIFYTYFNQEMSNRKKVVFNSLILFISSWIHPYVTIILFIVSCSLPLKLFIEDKKNYSLILYYFILSLTLILTSWLSIGYFGNSSQLYIKEFGVYSSNFNALFNSFDKSSLLKALPVAMDTQYEGYAYLGFGLILLFIIVCFDKRIKNENNIFCKKNIPILIFLSICLLISLSNKITFNQFSIEIPLNSYIEKFCGIFRSSGRFIWPVYYFTVISILLTWIKSDRSENQKIFFLLLVFILQLVDLKPLYSSNPKFSGTYKTNLDIKTWLNVIGDKHKKMLFYPAYSFKDFDKTNYQDFWLLSSLCKCQTNVGYFARGLNNEMQTTENDQIEKNIFNRAIPADTIYITSEKELKILEKKIKISLNNYQEIDGYIVLKNTLK